MTGQPGTLARLHPSIKGVAGAQSSGASLVSFNAPAFCSFEHEQGANAPVSDYAAFAYTTALNTLLADRNRVSRVGDTTILCWAAGGESAYQDCFLMCIFNDSYTENDILNTLHHLSKGESIQWDDTRLSPDTRFYVLGLAPNAARLSVRFFWQNSFGALARNLERHYQRLEIIRPSFDKFPTLPIWRLVLETVRKAPPGGRAPEPHPRLAGDLLLGRPERHPLSRHPVKRRRAAHPRRAKRLSGTGGHPQGVLHQISGTISTRFTHEGGFDRGTQ